MKHLLFSLIIAAVIFPWIGFAQQQREYNMNDFLNPGQSQEQQVWDWKEGEETASEYIDRIKIENTRRQSSGEPLLPDPMVTTNPGTPDNPNSWNNSGPSLDGPAFAPGSFSEPPSQQDRNVSELPPNIFDQIISRDAFEGKYRDQPLSLLLNQIFFAGLAIAVVLAVVMIILGGVQYMTIDAADAKDTGKKRVQAALGGLVLSFAAILILNTINPGLTTLTLSFEGLRKPPASESGAGGLASGTRGPGEPDGGPDAATGGSYSSMTSQELEEYTLQKIRSYGLTNLNPRDKAAFFPNGGTEEEWLALISAMMKYESNFKTDTTYTESFTNSKGERVISTGLLQLSYMSVQGYAPWNASLRNMTTEDLKDPRVNIDAGVTILKRLVERDGCISCTKGVNSEGQTIFGGGAAYWSVLRPTGKLSQVKATMRGQ